MVGSEGISIKINKRIVGIKLGAYNNEINHVKLGQIGRASCRERV